MTAVANAYAPEVAEPWPLPVGWRWEQIGNVADVVGGGTPATGDASNFGGEIPWITPADLSGYTAKYISRGARNISASGLNGSGARLLPAGSVLFSSRAPIGYVAIARNPVATNQGFKSFVLGSELLPDYVYHWLFVARDFAVKLASGTTFLEISGKKAAQLPVPIAPLAVQREVVAYLDEQLSRLDASVAALLRAQANLKRYAKSLIQTLVKRDESTAWMEVTVDKAALSLDNMRKPVNKTERALRGGRIPYLGANGQTGWIDEALFDEELVLVVEDETFVGRTQPFCYYFAGKCWVNNHTHVLRAKPNVVTPQYLNLALAYYPFIPLTTGSTGRRKLTKKALMTAPLSVPPLPEQHRIVAEADRRLSLIRGAEAQTSANLARAKRLRQSILQAAFAQPVSAGQ